MSIVSKLCIIRVRFAVLNTVMAAPGIHTANKSKKKNSNQNLLMQTIGWQILLRVTVLSLAWLAGFSARLFAVIRFESIIHEFDPW